jgi:ubiquitin-like modifier-activating enzyme ATG7
MCSGQAQEDLSRSGQFDPTLSDLRLMK